ncbi:MAG TPA: hypothetical protein VK798_11750, partial [Alloacidobacterium sp.]|nr:hypothetical protein [Alloacidobacterium sp.]
LGVVTRSSSSSIILHRWVTGVASCAPHPKPATNLLDSHHRSGRGACGFVLTGNTETTKQRASPRNFRIAD